MNETLHTRYEINLTAQFLPTSLKTSHYNILLVECKMKLICNAKKTPQIINDNVRGNLCLKVFFN